MIESIQGLSLGVALSRSGTVQHHLKKLPQPGDHLTQSAKSQPHFDPDYQWMGKTR